MSVHAKQKYSTYQKQILIHANDATLMERSACSAGSQTCFVMLEHIIHFYVSFHIIQLQHQAFWLVIIYNELYYYLYNFTVHCIAFISPA